MHITLTNINSQQKIGFEANLTLKNSNENRMLPQNGLQRLQKFAKNVGTNNDLIFVELSNQSTVKPINEWFYFGGKYIQEVVRAVDTKILMKHRKFGENEFNYIAENLASGSRNAKKMSTYKAIYRYLLDLKTKLG